MTSLKRLGTLVKGSSQAAFCLATPRLPVEHYKNWTRHQPFDDISSCRGQRLWTSQIATPLDKSLFEELTLQHVIVLLHTKKRSTYNETPEPGYIVRQSLRNFISDSWPGGEGRLLERKPSQLVLDQVLYQACEAAPIYAQFWPISLSWDWRTSVV